MPKYMLSVHHREDEVPPTEEVMQEMFAAVDAFNQKVTANGSWVFGGGLYPKESATVVDNTGPELLVTDGPFIEAKEHLGGFWVLEAPDLDAAMALAKDASGACRAPVEVRPFQDDT